MTAFPDTLCMWRTQKKERTTTDGVYTRNEPDRAWTVLAVLCVGRLMPQLLSLFLGVGALTTDACTIYLLAWCCFAIFIYSSLLLYLPMSVTVLSAPWRIRRTAPPVHCAHGALSRE